MRKMIFAILALMLVSAGLLFAASQGENVDTGGVQLNTPGQYPVVLGDKPYTIDVVGAYAPIESAGEFEDSLFSQYFEELTNVHVNFVELVSNEERERFNIIIASGDLPDVFMNYGGGSPQAIYSSALAGIYIPLEDHISNNMPGLATLFTNYPEMESQLTYPDGHIYATPSGGVSCFHCLTPFKMWVSKTWADKLDLAFPPKTTEDFRAMLRAFQNDDPNGNGKADEIPLAGATDKWNTNPADFLMNAFTHQGTYYLKRNGNEVSFVAVTPEYREGLIYINSLVEEGLLAPESYVQKSDQLMALVENPEARLVGAAPGGWTGVFSATGSGSLRYTDYVAIPPLKGPNGFQNAPKANVTYAHHVKITSQAERPDLIAQWLDWFYQEPIIEHQLLAQGFFQKGTDWRYVTAEEEDLGWLTVDGEGGGIRMLNDFQYGRDLYDNGWGGQFTAPLISPEYYAATDPARGDLTSDGYAGYLLDTATKEMLKYTSDFNLPSSLVISDPVLADELTELQDTFGGRNNLVAQLSSEFIVGVKDINDDKEWNRYIEELKRAGYERFVELTHKVLVDAGY